MRRYEGTFRPRAETDLVDIYQYIAEATGHLVARRFVERVQAACDGLATFPARGTQRDDIRPGLRIVGFERRAAIAFEIEKSRVRIIRVFYGGQDYERALRPSKERHRS